MLKTDSSKRADKQHQQKKLWYHNYVTETLKSIPTDVIFLTLTAIPAGFGFEAGAPALGSGVPVDAHILEGDVNSPAKAVISARVER
jgi:hypothetical protein